MGCCLSTTTDKSLASGPHEKHQHFLVGTQGPRSGVQESRAPPPVDEETVKEVLSETPRPKAPPSPPPFTKPQEQEDPVLVDQDQENKRAQEPVFEKKIEQEDPEKTEKKIPIYCNHGGEISEVSEICSLSESVSTTTITRDEDEEVQQRVNRSPMKLPRNRDPLVPRRERVVGKSPTRRLGPNGNNGVGSVRSVQSREPGQQQPMGRRGSRAESNRRDPGESSGRRSRSPATRITDNGGVHRSNVGRSPSARRYPGRTAVGPVESSSSSSTRRVAEEPNKEGKWPTNESIDNPLVSLECFIFL